MSVTSFLGKLARKLFDPEEGKTAPLDKKILARKAALELQTALSLFDNVTEKELIDYAIFRLNAAERRLVFLLQQGAGGKEKEGEKNTPGRKGHDPMGD